MDNCATNANCAIWWSNLELMQVAPPVDQIWNQFWWHHMVVKFWTNTSGTTYNWPNLEPMQVALYLAGEITQVKESIPWVRCASGNVSSYGPMAIWPNVAIWPYFECFGPFSHSKKGPKLKSMSKCRLWVYKFFLWPLDTHSHQWFDRRSKIQKKCFLGHPIAQHVIIA